MELTFSVDKYRDSVPPTSCPLSGSNTVILSNKQHVVSNQQLSPTLPTSLKLAALLKFDSWQKQRICAVLANEKHPQNCSNLGSAGVSSVFFSKKLEKVWLIDVCILINSSRVRPFSIPKNNGPQSDNCRLSTTFSSFNLKICKLFEQWQKKGTYRVSHAGGQCSLATNRRADLL